MITTFIIWKNLDFSTVLFIYPKTQLFSHESSLILIEL